MYVGSCFGWLVVVTFALWWVVADLGFGFDCWYGCLVLGRLVAG